MPPWLWLLLIVVDRSSLHRLATYAERRGWIYYRSDERGSTRTALMNLDVLVQPEIEHVIEAE